MQAECQISAPYTPSGGRQDFGLTARERQVIALVSAGYSNKDLAQKLGISENTARYHLTNVFDKLEVYGRLELILFALDQGLTAQE
ncbi:MAG: helix-turn-helix transcriptional regulator [Terriglobia bacterium]